MRKYDLCSRVASAAGMPRERAELAVEAVMEGIIEALKKSDEVHLRGFGTFCVVKRAKKRAFDMNRGCAIEIPERKVPLFKPSERFKKVISES